MAQGPVAVFEVLGLKMDEPGHAKTFPLNGTKGVQVPSGIIPNGFKVGNSHWV
jgi:hypothetical protein